MILERLLERRASPENPSTNLANPSEWLVDYFGGGDTHAGRKVSGQSAMQSSVVYACVRVLADTIASLPLVIYRRLPDGGKERAANHPSSGALKNNPNPWMTSFVWRETSQTHIHLFGNAYSVVEKNQNGRAVSFIPVKPTDVSVEFDDAGELTYTVKSGGTLSRMPSDRVLHIPGLGFDGISGRSDIGFARQAIGLSLGAEEYGARWFGNGARPSGVYTTPGTLTDKTRGKLREALKTIHGGVSNAHRIALLEGGVTWMPTSVPPEDSQFLETRRFQAEDIARVFRVPGHMIGIRDNQPRANVEQEAIDFVTHTVRPWLVRWEQEINRKLFDGTNFFAEFMVDGLLRGDFASRMAGFSTALQNGILNRNEARAMENRNAIEGGDKFTVQLNLQDVEDIGEDVSADTAIPAAPSGGARSVVLSPLRPLVYDVVQRLAGKESRAIKQGAKRCETKGEDWLVWVNAFYDDHASAVRMAFAPVVDAAANMTGRSSDDVIAIVGELSESYIREARGDVDRADDEQVLARCGSVFDEFCLMLENEQ